MQGGMMSQDGASISALDRLDRMEKMMSGMLEAAKGTRAALAPLYAVFTEEQKKGADQLIHGPMGMVRCSYVSPPMGMEQWNKASLPIRSSSH